jgi:6,7-dimethyl-8-ribityllumazine synthase
MGQAVTKGIIDLQLASMKPIGYGIIGPGAKYNQIESRLVPYARKAVLAVSEMLSN